MSEPTKPEPKPDDLTKTTDTKSIKLEEEDLDRVSGGGGTDFKGLIKT